MIGKYIVVVQIIDVNIDNHDSRATILFKYLCEIKDIVPEKQKIYNT